MSHHSSQAPAGSGIGVSSNDESAQSGDMSGNNNNNSSANERDGGEDAPIYPLQNNGIDEEESEDENDPSVDPSILTDDDADAESRRCSRRRKVKSTPKQCKKTCEKLKEDYNRVVRQWNEEVNSLREEHDKQIKELKERNKELEDQLVQLEETGRIIWKPWDGDLFKFLDIFRRRDPNDDSTDYLDLYRQIYKESYRQGNMSLTITHPGLQIVQTLYTRAEIEEHFANQQFHDPNNAPLDATFPFEKLPVRVQSQIWKRIIPNNKLIHCLSRFDFYYPPVDDNLNQEKKNFYPSRFHIGDEPCCVALADKPSTYLDYLCVSKRWYYVLAHLFYATNTFAFSSLGELGRFFRGIGRARTERVVHVELMWHGRLTPRQVKGNISLRKEPLHHFMFTSRLRTLVVHIDETAKWRMRRSYEMKIDDDYYRDFGSKEYATHEAEDKQLDKFQTEVQRTGLQQNYRKYRNMRTTHGMDFIYQLRGMKWVRFYDTNAEKPQTLIRDKSFLCDINNAATTKKSDSMALKSEIDNLRPLRLLEDYFPDDQTAELVAGFYDDTPVDDVSVDGSDTSSSDGSSDSDSGSDEDDDSSGYSSGSHSFRTTEEYDPESNNTTPEVDGGDDMDDDENRSGSAAAPIVIPDDNDNRRGRRRGRDHDVSTSDELFVRSGSCTAHTEIDIDSDDEVTVISQSSGFIDLTLDDDKNGAMDIDDADNALKEEEDEIEPEIKPEVDSDNDDDEVSFMKSEELAYQGLSPMRPSPGSDSGSNRSLKREASEDNSD